MNTRKPIYQDTLIVAVGQIVCAAVMIGVFALLGKFDMTVLWGAAAGTALTVANFFFMCLFADMAADKAEKQDVAGAQKLIQLSRTGRQMVLFAILVLCALLDVFNLLALVIPVALTTPILTVKELIKKKGGDHT